MYAASWRGAGLVLDAQPQPLTAAETDDGGHTVMSGDRAEAGARRHTCCFEWI